MKPTKKCYNCGAEYTFTGPTNREFGFDCCLSCGKILAVYPGGFTVKPTKAQLKTMSEMDRDFLKDYSEGIKKKEITKETIDEAVKLQDDLSTMLKEIFK